MGLTQLLGGVKKGPLFPWLLRCALTYFWEAAAHHGGHRGGPWRSWWWKEPAILGVCVGNTQSDLGRGQGGPVRPPATPYSPRNTSGVGCVGSRQCCPSGPQFLLLSGRATGLGSSRGLVQTDFGRSTAGQGACVLYICTGPPTPTVQVSPQLTDLPEATPSPGSPP